MYNKSVTAQNIVEESNQYISLLNQVEAEINFLSSKLEFIKTIYPPEAEKAQGLKFGTQLEDRIVSILRKLEELNKSINL